MEIREVKFRIAHISAGSVREYGLISEFGNSKLLRNDTQGPKYILNYKLTVLYF